MKPIDALAKASPGTRPATAEDAVQGIVPAYVVSPTRLAEAAEVMRVAAEHDLAVVPAGDRTKLHWGAPPTRCDLVVDTTALRLDDDTVVEHSPGDLVARVSAGLAVDVLNSMLQDAGQQLALDNPVGDGTVGGTLATAVAGPRRLLYGSARDLLIGITIVRADGAVAKSGGKVVKNVAGYDLGKLFTGSFGTLGLIVEATFRLHPRPAAQAYVTALAAGPQSAHAKIQAVLHSSLVPAAIEIDRPDPAGPVAVAVLVEGVPEGVPARAESVRRLLGDDAETSETPPLWWGRLPSGETLVRVTAKPTDLPAILADLEVIDLSAGRDRSITSRSAIRGAAGNGVWHVAFPAGSHPDQTADVVVRLRSAGRTAVVLTAPESVRERVDLWGTVPGLSLMRRVKDQFDPEHRLSPGRFVGGI